MSTSAGSKRPATTPFASPSKAAAKRSRTHYDYGDDDHDDGETSFTEEDQWSDGDTDSMIVDDDHDDGESLVPMPADDDLTSASSSEDGDEFTEYRVHSPWDRVTTGVSRNSSEPSPPASTNCRCGALQAEKACVNCTSHTIELQPEPGETAQVTACLPCVGMRSETPDPQRQSRSPEMTVGAGGEHESQGQNRRPRCSLTAPKGMATIATQRRRHGCRHAVPELLVEPLSIMVHGTAESYAPNKNTPMGNASRGREPSIGLAEVEDGGKGHGPCW